LKTEYRKSRIKEVISSKAKKKTINATHSKKDFMLSPQVLLVKLCLC